jgi:oxygen-independent coproporphyrinogen-3 oxidase
MKLLVEPSNLRQLATVIDQELPADYVYSYPPRQTYRRLPDDVLSSVVQASLTAPCDSFNLYVHVPFCHQICAFCNLYSVGRGNADLLARYVAAVKREMSSFRTSLGGKRVRTVYIGGGTPSLLPAALLEDLVQHIESCFECNIGDIPEVAIEVSPETLSPGLLDEYLRIGINRVNLGIQSFASRELCAIGRSYSGDAPLAALQQLARANFGNVCIDLIYGLEGQTIGDWQASIETALRWLPETVCVYPLTSRPWTGFAKRGFSGTDGRAKYARYDVARDLLVAAGYEQETHVRFRIAGTGGYQQKANHWACEAVVGFGAGARSYLWQCDYRNGYSVRNRRQALVSYLDAVESGGSARTEGFLMNDDERVRKAVVLGLIRLDREWFRKRFGSDPCDVFRGEFAGLSELGLVDTNDEMVRLTSKGLRHRDAIVQLFFSKKVHELVREFDYDE